MSIDFMECCKECENITRDQDGEETADCSDENCDCHLTIKQRVNNMKTYSESLAELVSLAKKDSLRDVYIKMLQRENNGTIISRDVLIEILKDLEEQL